MSRFHKMIKIMAIRIELPITIKSVKVNRVRVSLPLSAWINLFDVEVLCTFLEMLKIDPYGQVLAELSKEEQRASGQIPKTVGLIFGVAHTCVCHAARLGSLRACPAARRDRLAPSSSGRVRR